jgi:hypothetical protein
MFAFYLNVGVLILLLIAFSFFVLQAFNMLFRGFAPYVNTHPKVLKAILKELSVTDDATVIELGCGHAGFLRAVHNENPRTKLIGVEYSLLLVWSARLQNALAKTNIEIKRQNIIDTDLHSADIVYCYLNPDTMDKLRYKFEHELKKGSTVVSYKYPVPALEPHSVYDTHIKGEKVYFYQY